MLKTSKKGETQPKVYILKLENGGVFSAAVIESGYPKPTWRVMNMTMGEKIASYRKKQEWTQEELAERMGVSRQTVSKWESNLAYPETAKLIRLSELFCCSLDYLVKDGERGQEREELDGHVPGMSFSVCFGHPREYQSRLRIRGIPLVHIAKNAHGVFAFGLKAKGLIAFGLLPMGVISFGVLPIGLLSIGLVAVGLLAAGSFAIGIAAAGAISLGVLSFGGIALGLFSVGGLSVGKYAALGDYARAMVAIGKTEVYGTLVEKLGSLTANEAEMAKRILDDVVPGFLSWAKGLFGLIIG